MNESNVIGTYKYLGQFSFSFRSRSLIREHWRTLVSLIYLFIFALFATKADQFCIECCRNSEPLSSPNFDPQINTIDPVSTEYSIIYVAVY